MFGITRDRLVVEFKGGDRVYVDSEDIGLIRKYTGGEEPKLSKMGGGDWEKTRARVRKAVRDIAAELVILYRRRLATPGHAFAEDGPFQKQIEDAFPYEETPDQLTAIAETKADMERTVPMDRLICGDVGYGKTEVALRAAAKAVFDGAQVAVLVPTTLLASQHGQTFRERFANYPVRVEVLSRFLSTKEQSDSCQGRQGWPGRHRHRNAPPPVRRHRVQGPRLARRRRGTAVRRAAQGAHQEAAHQRRRADTERHADPAHAGDVAHGHPGSLARTDAARRPPADPHLRRRVRHPRRLRSDPPRAVARGPGLLRAQPREGHRARRGRRTRARSRRARRGRARSDGREPGSRGSSRSSGSGSTTCSCARRSSRAASICRR